MAINRDTIRANPVKTWVTVAAAVLAIISGIVTGIIKIDSRYAKAGDLSQAEVSITQQQQVHHDEIITQQQIMVTDLKKEQQIILKDLKKEQYEAQLDDLDNKVFEIEIKQQNDVATPVDAAMKGKYMRKITEVNGKMQALETPIR